MFDYVYLGHFLEGRCLGQLLCLLANVLGSCASLFAQISSKFDCFLAQLTLYSLRRRIIYMLDLIDQMRMCFVLQLLTHLFDRLAQRVELFAQNFRTFARLVAKLFLTTRK